MNVLNLGSRKSSSEGRGSFGRRLADRFPQAGMFRRSTRIVTLSIVLLGVSGLPRLADAGQKEQAASPPGPDAGRLVAEFHQDFRSGAFDYRSLRFEGGNIEQFVKPERDGLHIRIPAGLRNPAPVGVVPRFRIHGDFEITASFAIVKADKPIRGYGVSAALWVETDTPTAESATIERGIIPREGERFTSTRISGPPPPETRKYDVRRARAESRSGKIRMARVGSKVITSYADGDKPFRVLRSVELGPEDLTLARLAAHTGMSDHSIEICLQDLTIRAEALPGYEPRREKAGGSDARSRPEP
jgi:hypothetical protein